MQERASGAVAISYSYYEKDNVQKENFAFFLTHGIGSLQRYPLLRSTEVVVINNGYKCSPCAGLPIYSEQHRQAPRPRTCCKQSEPHLQTAS